jgi:hypothetical protein
MKPIPYLAFSLMAITSDTGARHVKFWYGDNHKHTYSTRNQTVRIAYVTSLWAEGTEVASYKVLLLGNNMKVCTVYIRFLICCPSYPSDPMALYF